MIDPYLAVTTDTAPGVAMPLAAATVGVAPEDDDDEDPPPHADSWNARTRAASAAMRKLMGSAPQQGLDGRHLRRTNNHAVNREQGGGAANLLPVGSQVPRTATDRGGSRRERKRPIGAVRQISENGGYVGSSSRDPRSRRASEQSEGSRPGPADRRADRRHRRVGVGQELAGFRHAVRRGSAPLRRDILAVCAPVPGPAGPPRGRPDRRRTAGHRDPPDPPGAHLAP